MGSPRSGLFLRKMRMKRRQPGESPYFLTHNGPNYPEWQVMAVIISQANSGVQQTVPGPGNRCQESEMMDREVSAFPGYANVHRPTAMIQARELALRPAWICAIPSCSDVATCHSNNRLRNVGTSFPLSVLAIFLFISNHKITVENTYKCPMFHVSTFGLLSSLI